jgi:hypothetical protein
MDENKELEKKLEAVQAELFNQLIVDFEKDTGTKLHEANLAFFRLGHQVGFKDAIRHITNNLDEFMYG